MPLFWRVFLTNAALLVAAAVALVVTPATVSFPVALTEVVVLAAGLGAVIALNLVLLRRVFQPLRALSALMRDVDPLKPGSRARIETRDRELAELTTAFNDMIDRLETERRESARSALKAQEDERLRVARELHDEVGQRLTAVMLQLDDQGAREEVRAALEEVREISRRLRPEALDDLGLAAALRSLITGLEQRTGLHVDRDIHTPGPLSSGAGAGRLSDRPGGPHERASAWQRRAGSRAAPLGGRRHGPGRRGHRARGSRRRLPTARASVGCANAPCWSVPSSTLGSPAGRGMRVRLVLEEMPGE